LAGKPEGRRLLGIPRLRWDDNIKMDRREVGWWGRDGWMDWLELAEDRGTWQVPVNAVVNLWDL
jgi:hypothetical protein